MPAHVTAVGPHPCTLRAGAACAMLLPSVLGLPRRLLALFRGNVVQPLVPLFHKGQAGRVLVLGGSEDYSGAPYFSAHAAMSTGADLVHVVCDGVAGPVIKGYSPDLMVHPVLVNSKSAGGGGEIGRLVPAVQRLVADQVLPPITSLLDRLVHAMVVGPGLGRDVVVLSTAASVLELALLRRGDERVPVVIDADGLYLVTVHPMVLQSLQGAADNSHVVLTPNIVEFQRLCKAAGVSVEPPRLLDPAYRVQLASQVSHAFHGVTVVVKGKEDVAVCGDTLLVVDPALPELAINVSPRRCGGQGDTFTGVLATFLAWGFNRHRGVWNGTDALVHRDLVLLACFGASVVVKHSARMAFAAKRRATLARDVGEYVGSAYELVVEGDEGEARL